MKLNFSNSSMVLPGMIKKIGLILMALMISLVQCTKEASQPTLYLIGDSTVKNGRGDGAQGLWGWGDFIQQFVDTTRIRVENHALGGTSSRTFQTRDLWTPVLDRLKPGDYIFMQFGHNDAGNINDDLRARGTIKGIGEETEEIDNMLTHEHEIVHTYGWYMRKFIRDAKSKGAIPVIFSPIPRNDWQDGRVARNNEDSYGLWARQVAEQEGILFVDLNEKMAAAMEELGEEEITGTYFYKRDHTHTSARGAVLAASLVIDGIKASDLKKLKKCLLDNPQIVLPEKRNVFIIGDSTVANGNDSIVGWGRELPAFFVTDCVNIHNKARGGRSSRTYLYEGLWQEVLDKLQPGDFVIMQFGHNDGGNIDREKFRGSLKGTGDETVEVTRPDGSKETVHTYGWYMKKYISDTKSKGAEAIVLSQVPRNRWIKGRVERVADNYGKWAREATQTEGGIFIDLNEAVAVKYEKMGPEEVKRFFPGDHTHTNQEGAYLSARTLAEEILRCRETELRKYVVLP